MRLTRIFAFIMICLVAGCKTVSPLDSYQKLSDEQIYTHALQNLNKHRYEEASKGFEALDALYPFGDYSQRGQLNIITAYYKQDSNESALAAADRYIRLYPRADDVDYAYYMKGIINQGHDSWLSRWVHAEPSRRDVTAPKEALDDFSTLLTRFPQSQYAAASQRHVAELKELLAAHELNIAYYYMKRKAYVAAANRAADLLHDYPGTSKTRPALQVMLESYTALNEPEMVRQVRDRMK